MCTYTSNGSSSSLSPGSFSASIASLTLSFMTILSIKHILLRSHTDNNYSYFSLEWVRDSVAKHPSRDDWKFVKVGRGSLLSLSSFSSFLTHSVIEQFAIDDEMPYAPENFNIFCPTKIHSLQQY